MNIVKLIQGTPEWHEHRANHFNASDAPAMMGCSAYKTRTQLMHELSTGIIKEVDEATQRRFDKGHHFESLARPIAEGIIGDDLYPVTGTNGQLSASFDGLTMAGDICFEHKTLNNDLRGVKDVADLPLMYRVQMEQQLLVSGAEKCLFMASKFDDDDTLVEKVLFWYEPDYKLRAKIEAGWAQFEKDMEDYVPAAVIDAPKADAVIELPALFIRAKGEITTSNMNEFGESLKLKLTAVRAIKLVTDQDFSNAEAAAKQFRETCDKLKLAKEQMLEQTVSIGEAARMIDAWHEDLRLTALKLEKDVAAEKEAKKLAIISAAREEYASHIKSIEADIAPIRLGLPMPDFAASMKGKRLLSAWYDAVHSALANAKAEATLLADDYAKKLEFMRAHNDYKFLFSDLQQIIGKQYDDFMMLVNSRIEAHKKAEAAKLEAQRAAIQAEEEAKARSSVLAQKTIDDATDKANTDSEKSIFEPKEVKKADGNMECSQALISDFLKSRNFTDENKIRAVLVEFVKFQAKYN